MVSAKTKAYRVKWNREHYIPVAKLPLDSAKKQRERQKKNNKAWYERNKEEAKRRSLVWGKAHPKIRAAAQRRRLENGYREIANLKVRESRARNPEPHRDRFRRYRANKLAASGFHTEKQWIARVEFHGWCCVYCGVRLTPKTLTQDHRIPLSKSGTEWASNLVPACKPCNCRKRDRKNFEDVPRGR